MVLPETAGEPFLRHEETVADAGVFRIGLAPPGANPNLIFMHLNAKRLRAFAGNAF